MEVKENIEKAYNLISTICVSGDNVERMAMAREYMRKAYQLAGQETKEEDDG